LWLKNPRNLRLINDLRAYKALYNCRETFTDVMSALQIRLFMQNKPNFRKSQMNASLVITKDYEKKDTWLCGKTKPIQSQSKPIKANNMPKQSQFKPNLSRRSLWRSRNKPNFTIHSPKSLQALSWDPVFLSSTVQLFSCSNILIPSPLTYASPFRIMTYEITGLKIILTEKYGAYL
jgi:hypothetical protein